MACRPRPRISRIIRRCWCRSAGRRRCCPPRHQNRLLSAPPQAMPVPQGLAMRIAPAKEPGRIVYELERAGKIEARQTAAQGDTIHLGWSKWEAHVDAVLAHAELHRDMKEFTGDVTPMMASSLRPGLRAHLDRAGWYERAGGVDSCRDVARDFQRQRFRDDRLRRAGHSARLLDHAGEFRGAAR